MKNTFPIRSARHGDFVASSSSLKKELDALLHVIPKNRPIVYFDYPVHNNIGDLLIHYATEKFFADHGYKVRSAFSWRGRGWRMRTISRRATIVFHGGGNIGDLYPRHERMRHRLLKAFPNNLAVILPQSIHFEDQANQQRAVEEYARHKNLTMCVRDQKSATIEGLKDACQLLLLPDMAHSLENELPRVSPGAMSDQELYFFRTDRERRPDIEQSVTESEGELDTWDWSRLLTAKDEQQVDTHNQFHRHMYALGLTSWPYRRWAKYRNSLLKRAFALFQDRPAVYTDRLHGAILSMLAGNTVHLFDNSNSKLSAYYDTWKTGMNRVELVDRRSRQN